ncbi:uncharacterized protein Triagg1_6517 [Trichoderma aggressivum f. europaeum]|uniref:Uncharacterized protein n=1 Tax=Trichoderma aggressivum f. europaeum TaxID=173218 RepID=A0AAE1IBB2_9HYPO|nr:hypothetical protein Triagg1_6517 [Trichoderma aggressivum f. europaeum]
MGQDPPRRPSQQGFHNTFGQGRSIKRDSIQGDGQRASGDTAPNLKRIRTVDRPDERSPVDQRDHVEGSSPTTLVSHRPRHPDNLKQHPSNQLSKAPTSHLSGISVKPLLDLVFDRFAWSKVKSEASKSHKRAVRSQEHNHYHPSDYSSSPELLATQQRQNLDDMQRADKYMGEIDDRIASAMQPILRHISETWIKSSDASNASEERVASEAKMNTIQTTMKKEMEESFKKEVAESQQFIKELVGSQVTKLKEALAQENEQKLHSLQKTLAQEGEDRATSLRKTLIQENEKRVAEMKDSINREHKAKIAALENALANEAKNKDRIAALEKSLSNEAKNKDRIAALERSLSEEVRNKERITALEKSLSNEAKNKERIAALEKSLSNEAKNKDRIAALEKSLSEEARNKERIAALEKSLFEEVRNKERITMLEKSLSQEVRNKERIAALEKSLSEAIRTKERISELEKSLSEAVRTKERISELEKSLSKEVRNRDRIAELEKSLSEQVRNKDRIAELEKSVSEQANDKKKTADLEKTLSEQREKNSGLQKRVKIAEARLDRAEADQQLLVKSLVDPKELAFLKDRVLRLEEKHILLSESSVNRAQLAEQLRKLSLSQDDEFGKHEARMKDHSTIIKRLEGQLCDHFKLITENKQQKDAAASRLDSLESTISNFSAEWEEIKKRVEKLGSTRSASVPDDKIMEVIKPELEKWNEKIKENILKIQNKLQPFIVEERYKRETLEEQFGNITRQVSEIEKEHATIKTDYSGLRRQLNDQNRLNILEGSRIEEKLNSRIRLLDEFKSQMEGVYMQVESLNNWQTNFNTAGLYKDIISHINKTIPEGTAPQIIALKQKLNSIETRFAAWENTSNKRRKLPGGNVKVVNGRQIDAQ